MGPQCFGCQGYGHMKTECPTYLKSKGKAMAVTLSDGEVSDDESECDEDENFIAFTATAVMNESIFAEENLQVHQQGWSPHPYSQLWQSPWV